MKRRLTWVPADGLHSRSKIVRRTFQNWSQNVPKYGDPKQRLCRVSAGQMGCSHTPEARGMGTTLGRTLGTTLGTTAGGTQHTARSLVDRPWATNPVQGEGLLWLDEVLGSPDWSTSQQHVAGCCSCMRVGLRRAYESDSKFPHRGMSGRISSTVHRPVSGTMTGRIGTESRCPYAGRTAATVRLRNLLPQGPARTIFCT